MRTFLFILGFIWIAVAIGSLVIGPFVGFDEKRVQDELIEFKKKHRLNEVKNFLTAFIFLFAYFGYFLPATRPFIGISGSLISFCFLGMISKE